MAQANPQSKPQTIAIVTVRPWRLVEQDVDNGVVIGSTARTVDYAEQITVGRQLGLDLMASGKAITPAQIADAYERAGTKPPKEIVEQLVGLGYVDTAARVRSATEAPSAALAAQAAMIGEIVANAVAQALAAAGIAPKAAG